MKKTNTTLFAGVAVAIAAIATPSVASAAEINGWGDFKLYIDPGHEGRSNQGIWGYSEAEKVLDVALNIKQMLETYTDMPAENLKLCRMTVDDSIGLEERSDEANAWGADFYYSIHSDAGATENTIVTLFGGWRKDGVDIEKTPNGGKAYGDILEPNMKSVMRVGSRGNRYDRCFYQSGSQTHENQFPYLSVNRRSNMPSLLSEGAYHTIAYQQGRNMNKEYKRLEAFAAFQSLLRYHGLEVPAQTFLHGEIYNSENDQRINGAVVTVDGKTYTTDTFESLFNKYSKNPNLIHNGLYTFEGLEAGKEYEITVTAPGFDPYTGKVTINAGGAVSGDYVTFHDVALTNNAPAKVDAISITDPTSVSPIYPITLTFSRNMVRSTVEEAFKVNNNGEIGLKWINDYTLELDFSKLLPLWDYTITIDGSIAKNSQTDQFFDGDGDGEPGGNWVYEFTMAEPDLDAPAVISTYPAHDSEVVYTLKFPIRIEYDEEINWNDDKNGDCITVVDKDKNSYAGTTTHAVVNGKSVLHFFPAEPLPADHTFLVTVAPGLTDMSGNETTDEFNLRFMSEYRTATEYVELIPCDNETGFWNPAGSGSSAGLIKDECWTGNMPVNPFKANGTTMAMHYEFDDADAAENWFVRLYTPNTTSYQVKDTKVIFTYWIYGDGSNNTMNMLVRINDNTLKMKAEELPVDFRGWNLYTWDTENDEPKAFTGADPGFGRSRYLQFDAFTLTHEYTDPDDEDIPQTAWNGTVGINSLCYSKWDNNAERQSALSDIQMPDAVNDIAADNEGITLAVGADVLTIKAASDITAAHVFGVDGAQVALANGHGTVATANIAALPAGVYIVTVKTAEGSYTAKFVK